jgi:hypothetical protein
MKDLLSESSLIVGIYEPVGELDLAPSGLSFRLPASGCIDDKTNIACFAVFARRKTARSRADDGVFRQSLERFRVILWPRA